MGKTPLYIVWSPEGPTNPAKTYSDRGQAAWAAKRSARNHLGQTFHVMAKFETFAFQPPADAPAPGSASPTDTQGEE